MTFLPTPIRKGRLASARIAGPARYIATLLGSTDEQTTAHGRGKAAMVLADQQRKTRADLVASRITEAGKLASLKVEKAEVEGERRSVVSPLQHPCYLHKHPGPR